MMENFVYPAYTLHSPYRTLTRDHNMVVINGHIWHKPRGVLPQIVFPEERFGTVPEWADTQEKVDSWFLQHGGINLCNPYLKGDRHMRPGGFRLCLGVHPTYSSVAQAYELLSFGVGILRPVQTRQNRGLDCMFGIPALPKISSKHMKVLLYHIVAYDEKKDSERPWIVTKESYESTNLILADSFGELEQLKRRRNDEEFLQAYLRDMQEVTTFREKNSAFDNNKLMCPEAFHMHTDESIRVWLNHVQLGKWRAPPGSIDELSTRIDFLLANTVIDEKPEEVVTNYEYMSLLE